MSDDPTTNHTTTEVPERVPTDLPALAELIRAMPAGPSTSPDGDLFDRLQAQEGYEQASLLWKAAGTLLDHESEEVALLDTLGTAFDDAVNTLGRIAQLQKRLRDVGNIEYMEGAGVDAATMTRRAGVEVRAARALHREAARP